MFSVYNITLKSTTGFGELFRIDRYEETVGTIVGCLIGIQIIIGIQTCLPFLCAGVHVSNITEKRSNELDEIVMMRRKWHKQIDKQWRCCGVPPGFNLSFIF